MTVDPTPGTDRTSTFQQIVGELLDTLVAHTRAARGVCIGLPEPWTLDTAPPQAPAPTVPEALIEHVRRTGEAVILADARKPNAFSDDDYFRSRQPGRVVCLPVRRDGVPVAIVYLERDEPGGLSRDALRALHLHVARAGDQLELAELRAEASRAHDQLTRLDRALQASRNQLQAILDNMVDAVWLCDGTGTLTMVNEPGVRILGHEGREALIGRSIEDVAARMNARHLDGHVMTPDEVPLARALRGEIVSAVDLTVLDPRTGREVHLRINAAPVQDARGAIVGAVAAASNLTEIVELDRLKDEFLRVAAHELKTPVAIVKGYAEMLKRDADRDLPPTQRAMLDALGRGADRIDHIVSDLLFLHQLRTGRVELVVEGALDLGALARSVARRLEPDEASRRVRVSSERPVLVRGDRQLLQHVFTSLLSNALRFSPAGEPVDVTIEVDNAKDAVVSVRDRGVGIPRDRQEGLFEPFYRAHTDTAHDPGGMGGGLYLAKALVTRHGGTIGFTSEEGRGSTFTVRLPLTDPEASRPNGRR